MRISSNKTFGQRIIQLSELSRKKYFFWTSFVGAFPTFVFFYLISPLLQTKINDFQYDTMAFLISCLISTLTVTFFVSCSLDYMKYSPKVYGAVTNRTYLALAKNRFVQGIFDLFTNSAENKLNSIWNKRGEAIDHNTEKIERHDYDIENLNTAIIELKSIIETNKEKNEKEHLQWQEERKLDMEEIRRLNAEILKHSLAREKAQENETMALEKLDQATDVIIEQEKEIKKLKGE